MSTDPQAPDPDPATLPPDLGEQLRAARQAKKLSIRELARTLGLPPALIGHIPGFVLMLPVLALFGLSVGAVDATSNMQAVALQKRYGRSIILAFHGSWAPRSC